MVSATTTALLEEEASLDGATAAVGGAAKIKTCSHCFTSKTPLWRGNLCNACATYRNRNNRDRPLGNLPHAASQASAVAAKPTSKPKLTPKTAKPPRLALSLVQTQPRFFSSSMLSSTSSAPFASTSPSSTASALSSSAFTGSSSSSNVNTSDASGSLASQRPVRTIKASTRFALHEISLPHQRSFLRRQEHPQSEQQDAESSMMSAERPFYRQPTRFLPRSTSSPALLTSPVPTSSFSSSSSSRFHATVSNASAGSGDEHDVSECDDDEAESNSSNSNGGSGRFSSRGECLYREPIFSGGVDLKRKWQHVPSEHHALLNENIPPSAETEEVDFAWDSICSASSALHGSSHPLKRSRDGMMFAAGVRRHSSANREDDRRGYASFFPRSSSMPVRARRTASPARRHVLMREGAASQPGYEYVGLFNHKRSHQSVQDVYLHARTAGQVTADIFVLVNCPEGLERSSRVARSLPDAVARILESKSGLDLDRVDHQEFIKEQLMDLVLTCETMSPSSGSTNAATANCNNNNSNTAHNTIASSNMAPAMSTANTAALTSPSISMMDFFDASSLCMTESNSLSTSAAMSRASSDSSLLFAPVTHASSSLSSSLFADPFAASSSAAGCSRRDAIDENDRHASNISVAVLLGDHLIHCNIGSARTMLLSKLDADSDSRLPAVPYMSPGSESEFQDKDAAASSASSEKLVSYRVDFVSDSAAGALDSMDWSAASEDSSEYPSLCNSPETSTFFENISLPARASPRPPHSLMSSLSRLRSDLFMNEDWPSSLSPPPEPLSSPRGAFDRALSAEPSFPFSATAPAVPHASASASASGSKPSIHIQRIGLQKPSADPFVTGCPPLSPPASQASNDVASQAVPALEVHRVPSKAAATAPERILFMASQGLWSHLKPEWCCYEQNKAVADYLSKSVLVHQLDPQTLSQRLCDRDAAPAASTDGTHLFADQKDKLFDCTVISVFLN